MITGFKTSFYRRFLVAAVVLLTGTAFVRAEGEQAAASDPYDLTVVSRIDANGRLVDRVDYPFVNDPEVIGSWRSVDYVREPNKFDPAQRVHKGRLWLNFMIFDEGGNIIGNPLLKWTRGLVISPKDKTASAYQIEEIGGSTYMFYEWKNEKYGLKHLRPYYYVLKKVPPESIGVLEAMYGEQAQIPETSTIDANGIVADKIDYPFEDDPDVTGFWKSVDFVSEPNQFEPNQPRFKGELFFKEMTILPNGEATKGYTWTKGLLINERMKTAAKYLINEISGSKYMFFEWKSGDYTHRRTKPKYYVMRYEGDASSAPVEQPPLTPEQQFRQTFPEKIKQLNIDTTTPEQVIRIFGEPLRYKSNNKDYTKDNLPDNYSMVYPDKFKVCVRNKLVKELRYRNPGYPVYSVEVGALLEQVFNAVGRPTETIRGESIEDKSGVLYMDIVDATGYCYYKPVGKNVEYIFQNYRVEEIRQISSR
jgi:hypothetical protein